MRRPDRACGHATSKAGATRRPPGVTQRGLKRRRSCLARDPDGAANRNTGTAIRLPEGPTQGPTRTNESSAPEMETTSSIPVPSSALTSDSARRVASANQRVDERARNAGLRIVVIATDHPVLARIHSEVPAASANEGNKAVSNRNEPETSIATAPRLDEWLTAAEVAAWLKVSRNWVYEHTRARGTPRIERLPHIKLGKYVHFERRQVSAFLERRVTRS